MGIIGRKKIRFLVISSLAALSVLIGSVSAQAASVQKCSAKTKRCVIKLEEGVVGDTINVLNERAQLVATGWIIKRQGSYAIIKFKNIFRDVKRGYPVIVNIESRGKEVSWASVFE